MTRKHIILDEKQVEHIATLVNIKLTVEEKKKYAKELTSTLTAIESLDELDTAHVTPTYQTTGIKNRFLKPTNKRTLSQSEALKSARETKNGYFRINALQYSK